MNRFDNETGENPFRWCYLTGSSQKSSSAPVANPAFPMLQQNVQRATSVADRPFEAYGAPMTAGLSANEQQASASIPGLLNAGAPALNNAATSAQGLMGFQPSNVTAGSLPQTDLSPYMNPYQKQVTDTTMSDLERQRQIAANADTQRAQGASAYGGSRSGVAQSLTNEAAGRTAASTLAGLNFGNFNNAQTIATGDLNRTLSADQGNQNAGIAGAGINRDAAALSASVGGQQNSIFQRYLDNLTSSGATARGVEQSGLDAAYQEFLRRLNQPYQGQTLLNQSLGLLPGGVSTNQQGSQSGFGFTLPMPGK